jgi:hypothetical protein
MALGKRGWFPHRVPVASYFLLRTLAIHRQEVSASRAARKGFTRAFFAPSAPRRLLLCFRHRN